MRSASATTPPHDKIRHLTLDAVQAVSAAACYNRLQGDLYADGSVELLGDDRQLGPIFPTLRNFSATDGPMGQTFT